MSDWDWITPQVALGSAPSRSDVPVMQRAGITDVLDLRGEPRQGETGPQPGVYAGTGIQYHYVGMLDRGGTEPVAAYVAGVQAIENAVAQGGKILVHCSAGMYRSPSMVYAYLRATGMSPSDAWNAITQARPVAQTQYLNSAEAAVPYLPSGPSMGASVGGPAGSAAVVGLVTLGTYLLVRRVRR